VCAAFLLPGLIGCTGGVQAAPPSDHPESSDAATAAVALGPEVRPIETAVLPPLVDDAEFCRAMGRSVFLLEILEEEDRVVAQATAFCVGPSRVLTAWHAVQFARKARIRTDGGETFFVKGVLAHDSDHDLALLLVALPTDGFRPLALSTAAPRAGDRVCLVGAPFFLGEGCSPSYGVVLGASIDPARFRARVPVAPGWSGSPLLDGRGDVFGIVGATVGPTAIATVSGAARPLVEGATNPDAAVPLEQLTPRGQYGRAVDERASEKWEVSARLEPAVQALIRGDLDATEKSLRVVLKEDPKDAIAWEMLYFVEDKRGRVEQALDALRMVRDLRFDDSRAWYTLGTALQASGRYREAVETFAGAVARNPKDRDALYGLGHSYSKLQQWDDAIAAWKRVLELDPSYAAAQQGINYAEAMRKRR
jgi:hypothetical protein